MRRWIPILVLTVLVACGGLGRAVAADPASELCGEYHPLLQAARGGSLDRRQVAALRRSEAADQGRREWIAAVLAEQLAAEGRPDQALAQLSAVLGADPPRQRAWRAAIQQRPPQLPAIEQWRIDSRSAPAVAAVARIAHAAWDVPVAWHAARRLSAVDSPVARLLAGELLVELADADGDAAEARTAVRWVLDEVVPTLRDRYSGQVPEGFQGVIAVLRDRETAFADAADAVDYGEAFVRYRRAERWRHGDESLLPAVVVYRGIRRDWPGTVWAEAALAGEVAVLFRLANEAVARREQERIHAARAQGTLDPGWPALATLRELPIGRRAGDAASGLVSVALRDEEFGLYRGELLLARAIHATEELWDAPAAEADLDRLWDWLGTVESAQVALPEPVRVPDAPPPRAFVRDQQGAVDAAEIIPGAIINRRSCGWYLDALRERCCRAQAFMALHREQPDAGVAWIERALELPAARLAGATPFSNLSRLRWGLEHGYLFAYPQELAGFDGERRLGLLVADYAWVTKRYRRAHELATALLHRGRLRAAQRDYVHYLLASATMQLEGRDAAVPLLEAVLQRREGTLSEDRARYLYGNIARLTRDPEIFERGHELLHELASAPRQTEFVWRARVEYGWRLLGGSEPAAGRKLLASIGPQAGIYHTLATRLLREHQAAAQAEE